MRLYNKGLTRYKGTRNKYFPSSFNFGVSGDRAENVHWRDVNLPDMPYLKSAIFLSGTNNVCNDSPHDIA